MAAVFSSLTKEGLKLLGEKVLPMNPMNISTANNKKITMGVFYRPPNSNLTVLEDLQNSLSNITTTDIVLLGDFNLGEIDWANNRSLRNSEHHIQLFDMIQDNFMHQLVNKPRPKHIGPRTND